MERRVLLQRLNNGALFVVPARGKRHPLNVCVLCNPPADAARRGDSNNFLSGVPRCHAHSGKVLIFKMVFFS